MDTVNPVALRIVNDTRSELGLVPLTAARFGLGGIGFRGMSRAERSAKAKKQLRDRFGRFAEMGGHMSWKDNDGVERPGRFLGVTDSGDVLIGDAANSRIRRVKPDAIRAIEAEATLPEKKDDNPLGSPFDLDGDGTVEPQEIRRRLEQVEGKPYELDPEPDEDKEPFRLEGDPRIKEEKEKEEKPVGHRPAPVLTSMDALDQDGKDFVNNGGGTEDDPVHVYEWEDGRTLTVRQSEVQKHYEDVLAMAEKGEAFHDKANLQQLEAARNWYHEAHRIAMEILAEHPNTGLTLEQVAGVLAAVSPRKAWDVWTTDKKGKKKQSGNIADAKKIINAFLYGKVGDVPISELDIDVSKKLTKGGMHSHVAAALRILKNEPDALTGTKRRSFWNNIFDPKNKYDATIDGWMAAALFRMNMKYSDGAEVDEDALSWVDHTVTKDKKILVPGAGYVVLADAIRAAGAKYGLSPSEAQAIYWTSVGGGSNSASMWSHTKRTAGETAAKKAARQEVLKAFRAEKKRLKEEAAEVKRQEMAAKKAAAAEKREAAAAERLRKAEERAAAAEARRIAAEAKRAAKPG